MVLGNYKEAVSARATDKKIMEVAQDGGIVSALLIHAIESGVIEGAVVAQDPADDWAPVPTVATTADEILAAAGTKYSMSPTVFGIKEAVRQFGLEKIGVVATPCQTQGIRKVQAYPFSTRFIGDKIKLVLGIYCMENFPMASLDTFSEAMMDTDLKDVDKMDIGKGKFMIQTGGEEKGIGLKKTHGYEQAGCNICTDYVCEFSDLSTGSVGSPDGWSTVLTRTGAGVDLFKSAVDAGLIETKPMDEVKPGLPLLKKLAKGKKEKNAAEREKRVKMGIPIPTLY
ncbi:MAG: coenzyme F420 hydrogenase subunit beta [Methanobrevibacter sp.]|nr:coenzyme F420 hydrogenase subunit beta [Methanobrevibacter sp.]